MGPITKSDNKGITKELILNALKNEANADFNSEIVYYNISLGSTPGDNYTSLIYSIDLELKDKPSSEDRKQKVQTRHLLIKCYPNHPSRQEFTNVCNMFFKEMEVYSKWLPELRRFQKDVLGLTDNDVLKLPYVPYVHGECIDFESVEGQSHKSGVIDSLDNYLIMEDIRKTWGFRMTNRREPLDLEHMRLVMDTLARIHSLSWAYRAHVEQDITGKFPCLVTNFKDTSVSELWLTVLKANSVQAQEIFDKQFGEGNELSVAAQRFKGAMSQVLDCFLGQGDYSKLEDLLRVKPVPERFGKDSSNNEPWRIICHGDCWSNNMLFRYDASGKPVELMLVDLQIVQETCVVNDLQYVIYVCMDSDIRKRYLNDLLQLYHDKFNGYCKLLKTDTLPGFTMESLKYRFHRSKFLGYLLATMGLPIMLKEESEAVDLEKMEGGKDAAEMFSDVIGDARGNLILQKRLIELTKELLDEGVL